MSDHLAKLPEWIERNDAIRRTFQFTVFAHAMSFVNQIAEAADSANHHPDIDIRYNKVTLVLSTHDSGGITELDVQLAAVADDLATVAV